MDELYQMVISALASSDLDRLFNYVSASSPAGAQALRDRIFENMESLRLLPHRTIVAERRSSEAVRSAPVGNYIIYFRVIEARRVVQIPRVYHGARRQPGRFQ